MTGSWTATWRLHTVNRVRQRRGQRRRRYGSSPISATRHRHRSRMGAASQRHRCRQCSDHRCRSSGANSLTISRSNPGSVTLRTRYGWAGAFTYTASDGPRHTERAVDVTRDTAGAISGGNGLANILIGGNVGSTLDGAAGNDIVLAGAGNDTIESSLGDDTIDGRGGDDVDGGAGLTPSGCEWRGAGGDTFVVRQHQPRPSASTRPPQRWPRSPASSSDPNAEIVITRTTPTAAPIIAGTLRDRRDPHRQCRALRNHRTGGARYLPDHRRFLPHQPAPQHHHHRRAMPATTWSTSRR